MLIERLALVLPLSLRSQRVGPLVSRDRSKTNGGAAMRSPPIPQTFDRPSTTDISARPIRGVRLMREGTKHISDTHCSILRVVVL